MYKGDDFGCRRHGNFDVVSQIAPLIVNYDTMISSRHTKGVKFPIMPTSPRLNHCKSTTSIIFRAKLHRKENVYTGTLSKIRLDGSDDPKTVILFRSPLSVSEEAYVYWSQSNEDMKSCTEGGKGFSVRISGYVTLPVILIPFSYPLPFHRINSTSSFCT